MAKKSVVDYVRGMIKKGYPVSTIKTTMLKYGYSNNDIDGAVQEACNPTIRHEIHLSKTTIFVLIFICLAIAGTAWFIFYTPKAPDKLLDLSLEPVTTTAEPGQSILFIKQLSNLGSSKRYDVIVKQEILDAKTFKQITEKTETRAVETFGTTQTSMGIPSDAKPGDYLLRAIVEYGNQRAVATLPVKITEITGTRGTKESCSDGIKNQDEDGIDCGGICAPCGKGTENCDDSNPCTQDIFDNGACKNNPIAPCCGNGACEGSEKDNCAEDCKNTVTNTGTAGLQTTDTIEQIRELGKTDPAKAMQQCNQIDIPDLKETCISKIGEVQKNKNYCSQISTQRTKDICFSAVAKALNDNSVCEDITTDGIKDSCYMSFVLDYKDYSVCGKLTNKQLGEACEYLRQLNEISKQQNQGENEQLPDDKVTQ